MKFCINCIHCIYTGRVHNGEKKYECKASSEITINPVTGEKNIHYIDCHAERIAGVCGLHAQNFVNKNDPIPSQENKSSGNNIGVFGLPESMGGGIGFF